MVKIVKAGEKKNKETKSEKEKRQYETHKARLEELKKKGVYDEFMDGNKCGRDIAKRAKINQMALPRETPPHDLPQFKAGCKAYFKKISDKKKEVVVGEQIMEVKDTYPMTLEGLMVHLGISHYWWSKYENGEGFENYHNIAKAARLTIQQSILEGGLTNKFNAKLSAMYLKNISNLRENPDGTIESGVKNITFITVNNKEELQAIETEGEILDAEVIEDEP
jgi:hypothetical protein